MQTDNVLSARTKRGLPDKRQSVTIEEFTVYAERATLQAFPDDVASFVENRGIRLAGPHGQFYAANPPTPCGVD